MLHKFPYHITLRLWHYTTDSLCCLGCTVVMTSYYAQKITIYPMLECFKQCPITLMVCPYYAASYQLIA